MALVTFDTNKTYISQAICIVSYEQDKNIRYEQKAVEECFKPVINVQSQQTNIPDDMDPAAPRFIFHSNVSKQILVSQVAAQFNLGFESAANRSPKEQISILCKNVKDFSRHVSKLKSAEQIKEYALILNIHFPNSTYSSREMGEYLHERFLNFPAISSVATTSFKVGYLLPEKLYLNLTADMYELRKGQFTHSNAPTNIDISKLPISESGLLFQIDINTRPKLSADPNDIDVILEKSSEFVENELYQFLGIEAQA